MNLLTAYAQAYVNHGRWIADCVRPDCANAEKLKAGQGSMHCTNCHHVSSVTWPPAADQITAVLEARPVPQTRNWAPAGHRQAVACGVPGGQTVEDLRNENTEHGVVA